MHTLPSLLLQFLFIQLVEHFEVTVLLLTNLISVLFYGSSLSHNSETKGMTLIACYHQTILFSDNCKMQYVNNFTFILTILCINQPIMTNYQHTKLITTGYNYHNAINFLFPNVDSIFVQEAGDEKTSKFINYN